MRWIVLILVSLLLTEVDAAAGDVPPSRHHLHHGPGAYYPGYYYSRAYMQPFRLRPGEQVLTFRLHPYQHYGKHGAVDGAQMVAGEDFAYRYAPGFTSALAAPQAARSAEPMPQFERPPAPFPKPKTDN